MRLNFNHLLLKQLKTLLAQGGDPILGGKGCENAVNFLFAVYS